MSRDHLGKKQSLGLLINYKVQIGNQTTAEVDLNEIAN